MPFDTYPLAVNVGLFVAGAAAVWVAGTRLARYADALAHQTRIGHAFIGAILLGGVTSLPEIATVVTAARLGNAPLAVNNMLGSVAMQVAILAAADSMMRRHPIARLVPDPVVLLQGVLLIFVLANVLLGVTLGDRLVFGIGAWSWLILAVSLGAFFLIHRFDGHRTWKVDGMPRAATADASKTPGRATLGTRHLAVGSVTAAVVILVAGFVLAHVGDALARQTGLGSHFLGMALLATATSLPELSTTLSAVRLGAVTMAYSNIFGANILDTAILFLADAVYPGGPVLEAVGQFSAAATVLGIGLTAIALTGLLVRPTRQVLGLGPDSWALVMAYLAGLWLLYGIR
ncbi:sodium:calcium antiporter [soil metagenome]|nr:sodium:calcium antiporter [Acidobacteriota bacterium]